jgi:hypothetical protein
MDSQEKIRVDNEKIKCRSCEKELFGVLIFGQPIADYRTGFQKFVSPQSNSIQANCPYCDDKSWEKHYNSKTMLSPLHGLYFKNIDQEIVNEDELLTRIEIGISS